MVAFQPHRYTRTRDLWDDFARAFNDADVLIVTEIYAAGEDKIPGVDAAGLVQAIRAHGHRDAEFVADLDRVLERLAARARPGDLVMTLGAGSVSSLSDRAAGALREGARVIAPEARERLAQALGPRVALRRAAWRASPRCGSAVRPTRSRRRPTARELARAAARSAPRTRLPHLRARRRLQHARARRPRSTAW